MKTANYITSKECTYAKNTWESKTLPAGTFVKPIDPYWLPRHIKESNDFRWFDNNKEVFVYCSQGIIVIPKNIIREV